jgi:poly-gamma-glutamate capsule biosynthesis protein CapA/YwtB (metallophosphatase superfamily)
LEENTNKRISVFILIFLVLFSCKLKNETAEINVEDIHNEEEKSKRYSLTLIAAGDNLFHETIIGTHKENDTYNFSPIYTEIKSIVENADLAFINQETVMGGERFGYSGYPTFNTPQSLAKTIADTGFDIVNQATNHSMDMGRDGLYAALNLWEKTEGITVIGARKTGVSRRIAVKNNISLGFLSYTYGLNGFALPAGEPNLVSLINKNKMTEEIKALRPLCDFLIVSMHWGEEYLLAEPGADQIELARFLAGLDVDLIIGHHPHVLQRTETLIRPNGKKTLCFYSLGNFVSNQREKERILGALMLVTFTKEGLVLLPYELSISNYAMIPVICHFESNYKNTKVYPLYSYTQELLDKHLLLQFDKTMDMNFFYSVLTRLGTKMIMHDPFPVSN